MANSIKFAVGGAVQAKAGTYLWRPADEELFAACKAGEFAYVLSCRQIGKSSLMFETARRLSEAGTKTALIDLNGIGQDVNADKWYFSLIDEVARRLQLEIDVQNWWDTRPRLSAAPSRFLQFFREVVLQQIKEPVVIFIDEIDVTLGLPFTDDFFAAIRVAHNDRVQEPVYQRLTFVLLGVATPDELIKDNTRTPFNIGQAITLSDFTRAECAPFRTALETKYPEQGGIYFDQIYDWTGGHPYLTQKLCEAVLKTSMAGTPDLVEISVRKIFLAPEARGEDNIQFVQTRVSNDAYAQPMLRLYKRVLQNEEAVPDDEQSPAINRLKLYGLVVARQGQLKIRNGLYARAFDLAWVEQMLTSLKLGLPDKYTLLQKIGQRDCVTVYLAQMQEHHTSRFVALKVLNLQQEEEANWAGWIDRLEQEVQFVAKVSHPHLIRIFETGRIDEKTLFIVMEYIPGGSLRTKLKHGPLPRNEAVTLIRQIGAALSHAHQQDLLHLGLNPNEILLDSQRESVRPVLTDFGFAKLLAVASQSPICRAYLAVAAPYLAPEQEQLAAPSLATDVYALAVTLFEMLAGRLPPDRQIGEPLPPLSLLNSEVGELFDDVLMKATASNPADRYQSIADFITALETAQQSEAAKAIEATQSYMKLGNYNPQIALEVIKPIFAIYPDHPQALRLRGKIQLKQGQFATALADYKRAYEQECDPASEAGREYLAALTHVAEITWLEQAHAEAVKHYEEIRQILDGRDDDETLQKIRAKAWTRLVEYHYNEGKKAYYAANFENIAAAIEVLEDLAAEQESRDLKEKLRLLHVEHHYNAGLAAYAEGSPEDIDKATEMLAEEIRWLEAAAAQRESQDLKRKWKALHIKKYENIIRIQKATINVIKAQDNVTDETIFKHYLEIDEAYQKLTELEPENQEWLANRRKNLKEKAERRHLVANKAEKGLDYETAIRHYRAIRNIEETRYEGLVGELNLNVELKIAELEKKVDYDRKYREIEKLIEHGDHLRALNQLVENFINAGNYEHRDVPKLFWGLVYAKQNEGKFPPEWNSLTEAKKELAVAQTEVATIRAKLAETEQEASRVQAEFRTAQTRLAEIEQEIEQRRTETATTQSQLTRTKQELDQAQAELSLAQTQLREAQQQMDREQAEAATLQASLAAAAQEARAAQAQVYETQQALQKLKRFSRYHELNKYVIPVSLIVAVLAGGLIAPALQHLAGLFVITLVASALLLAYFVYYVWIYYLS